MNDEQLKQSKQLLFLALGIDAGVTAITAISDFWTIGVLTDIRSGAREVTESLVETLSMWDKFSFVMIITVLGVGLALVKWLNACYRFAKESIGARGFQNDGWTVGAWIVPIINLFKPYQIINEIYKAGAVGYRSPEDWKKEAGSGVLLGWWICWVAVHLFLWGASKQVFRTSLSSDATLPQLVGASAFHASICVLSLVISAMWFAVSNYLTQRLIRRGPLSVRSESPARSGPENIESASKRTQYRSEVGSAMSGSTSNLKSAPASAVNPAITGRQQRSNSEQEMKTAPATANGDLAFDERRTYARIAEEVEQRQQDKGLWMKALVEAQGDPTKQVVLYAQLRIQDERERCEAELARREAQAREALETDETRKLRERLAALPGHHGPVELLKEFEFNNLVDQMIQQGTELNLPFTAAGDTLLHIAARANYYNAVGQLLKRGAWIAAKNSDGKTPLDLAEQHDSAFAASLLMEAVRKSDVAREKATKQLKSPVSIADYCIRHEVSERDVRAMINAGNLNAYVWGGHMFVEDMSPPRRELGTCPNCEALIPMEQERCAKCGAIFKGGDSSNIGPLSPNKIDDTNKSSPRMANVFKDGTVSASDVMALVRGVEEQKVDPNLILTVSGMTLLHVAVDHNLPDAVLTLLAAGSNRDRKDARGLTPRTLAMRLGHSRCERALGE